MASRPAPGPAAQPTGRLARLVLYSFVLTFVVARGIVLLILLRWLPDLYLHLGGTHVHHLNYGIFLLAGVGAYLLFGRPDRAALSAAAVAYGVGLALTFDEFGIWLHLGGSYWQRASFDAIVIIAALLILIAYTPGWRWVRQRHWPAVLLLVLALAAFGALLVYGSSWAGRRLGPRVQRLEQAAPR
jgi:uncharacterized membrane protein